MAVLAWLMLVMHTVAANPMAAMGMAASPVYAHAMSASAMPMTMAADSHASGAMKMSTNPSGHVCCDEGARHAVPDSTCHCAAMSGGLLPPLLSIPMPAALASNYARPAVSGTPASHTAPPLRPPAA